MTRAAHPAVPPPIWAIYGADKLSAAICTELQVNGFAFDRTRANELSSELMRIESRAELTAFEAAGRDGFKINSPPQLWGAFRELGAPVYFRSAITKRPSMGVDSMRAYAANGSDAIRQLAISVLEFRRARKVRRVYLDGVTVSAKGRVHPSWHNYGTVSGRWSCQRPNLMNIVHPTRDPVIALGGIRSVYHAPKGYRLVTFDMAQLEMRIAAYASGDPVMIAACESSDLHSTNAELIFGDRELPERVGGGHFTAARYLALAGKVERTEAEAATFKALKFLRQLAKTAGFAVCYLAEAGTVYAKILSEGEVIRLREVEQMLQIMRRRFRDYYRWQDSRLLDCIRTGYVESPIVGRRRWLGHTPEPTKAANFPIQAGAADLMNTRLPELLQRQRDAGLDCIPVAQVHDSFVQQVAERDVEACSALCREVFEAPLAIASSGARLTASFPIDLEISERWS